MGKIPKTLCQTIRAASRKTWRDLRDGQRTTLSISEESITDYFLLELARNHPDQVRLRKFTRNQEGTQTGADWEWWFGSRGAWFGMRVQAKRLKTKSSFLEYPSLHQMAGKSGVRQVDLLIQDACNRSLFPLYCFYNYVQATTLFPGGSTCPQHRPNADLWGCSIANAFAIRQKIDAYCVSFDSIKSISRPLMCLFCCPDHNNKGLADAAFEWANTLLDQSQIHAEMHMVPTVITDLPYYVKAAFELPLFLSETPSFIPDGIDRILVIEENE